MAIKLRHAGDMRWYLYRSASKLDMLFEQMVSRRAPFTGTLSVEVPGIKASIGTPSAEPPNTDERIDLVEKGLEECGLIGTIEEPRDYIRGEIPMRWGLYNDHGERRGEEPPLVFFGGLKRDDAIIVGLGGSSKHVVGHDGASSTYSRSSTPTLVRWLLAGLEDARPRTWREPESEEHEVLGAVGIALHYLRPPTQPLRFLAKTLMAGTLHGYEHMIGLPQARVLLGSPLYVTMAKPLEDENRYGLDDQW